MPGPGVRVLVGQDPEIPVPPIATTQPARDTEHASVWIDSLTCTVAEGSTDSKGVVSR